MVIIKIDVSLKTCNSGDPGFHKEDSLVDSKPKLWN